MRACAGCGEWIGGAHASCPHCDLAEVTPPADDEPAKPGWAPDVPADWDQYVGRYVTPRRRRFVRRPDEQAS